MVMVVISLVLFLWLWPGGPVAQPVPPQLEPEGAVGPEGRFPYFRLPRNLTLCGEPVPLQDTAVREDLEREFTIVVWSRAQTTMWLKRAHRFFPEVERKLRSQKLPQDLKYVVLVESDLRPKVRSAAGALGPWQFMGPTAQRFNLKIGEAVDERLDFTASTEAALQYLKSLHQMFNNWALAMAAYNCGEGRVKKAMAVQGVGDYYRLSLPEETERYVPRIMAAKVVLESPGRYGYDIPPGELYAALEYDETEVIATQEVTVRALAETAGSYYKAIKALNPWIKGDSLPAGVYRLRVPKGAGARFRLY